MCACSTNVPPHGSIVSRPTRIAAVIPYWLDEADDPRTEVIPTVLPAELRKHVKEER